MRGDEVEVVYDQDHDRWQVQVGGEEVLHDDFAVKADAVIAAREASEERQADLVIQNQDGTVAARDSGRPDPYDVLG